MESCQREKPLSEECLKALNVDDLRVVLAIDGKGNVTPFAPRGKEGKPTDFPIKITEGRILSQAALTLLSYEASPEELVVCGSFAGQWICFSYA